MASDLCHFQYILQRNDVHGEFHAEIRRFLLLQALGKLTQRGFWAAAEGHDACHSNRYEGERVLWGMSRKGHGET